MPQSTADAALARLPDQIEAAVLGRLQRAADTLEGVLVATTAYNDDTGANRGATYAAAATNQHSGEAQRRARRALAEAERLNPGYEAAEDVDVPPGVVRVVGTSMTRYAEHLEQSRAGQNAYLADTMRLEAPRLQDAALDGVREVVG